MRNCACVPRVALVIIMSAPVSIETTDSNCQRVKKGVVMYWHSAAT